MAHLEFYDPAEHEPDEPDVFRFTSAVAQIQRMMARGELVMTGVIVRYMQQLGASLPEDQQSLYEQYLSDTISPWIQDEQEKFVALVSAFQDCHEAVKQPLPPSTGPVRNQFARRRKGVKKR